MLTDDLAENLQSQVVSHQGLLQVLDEELELTAHCTIDDLENIQHQRDRLTSEIFQLEQTRIQILDKYCKKNSLREEVSISEILKNCDISVRSILQELKSQLIHLMQQIREAGRKVAEQSILRSNCITEVQNVVHRALQRQTLYSNQGKITKPKGAMVLQKAI
ncbi:MAG: flagellar protein FlgN [Proteobacteria bacterium]|nr:flagellar protein FlgN [Pseudomonadota bacterium]